MKVEEFIERLSFKCYWNKDLTCKSNAHFCNICEHQPPDDEKSNGKNTPVTIEWEVDFYSNSKFPLCPSCGEMPYSTERCVFCGQKFIQDDEIAEYNKPPQTVRMDCIMCGGKNTLVGVRANCNGHFHGTCEKCGCRVVE